jgi:hypothetical protein
MIAAVIAGLVVTLFLGTFSSIVAQENARSPVVWFVIGGLFPLLGLIIVCVLPPGTSSVSAQELERKKQELLRV